MWWEGRNRKGLRLTDASVEVLFRQMLMPQAGIIRSRLIGAGGLGGKKTQQQKVTQPVLYSLA